MRSNSRSKVTHLRRLSDEYPNPFFGYATCGQPKRVRASRREEFVTCKRCLRKLGRRVT